MVAKPHRDKVEVWDEGGSHQLQYLTATAQATVVCSSKNVGSIQPEEDANIVFDEIALLNS